MKTKEVFGLALLLILIPLLSADNITINNTYYYNQTFNQTYYINTTINQTINNTFWINETSFIYYNITNITCINCTYNYNVTNNITNNFTTVIYNGTINLTDIYSKAQVDALLSSKQSQIDEIKNNYLKKSEYVYVNQTEIPEKQATRNVWFIIGIIVAILLGLVAIAMNFSGE